MINKNHKHIYFLFNNSGVTLAELIITVGLLSFVGLLLSAILFQSSVFFDNSDKDLAVEALHAQIILLFSNPDACYNTFLATNRTDPSTSITVIKNQLNNNIYQVGLTYMRTVKINSFTVQGYNNTPTAMAINPFTGKFDLLIEYQTNISDSEARKKTRVISIYSAPSWVAGLPVTENTVKCSSGQGFNFGYDTNSYINKSIDPNKNGDLTVFSGDLIVNGITTVSSGTYIISDKTMKKNIKEIFLLKNNITDISGFKFKWKQTNTSDYGFIAQNIEKIFPTLVTTQPDSQFKTVEYSGLVSILGQSSSQVLVEKNSFYRRINTINAKLANNKPIKD